MVSVEGCVVSIPKSASCANFLPAQGPAQDRCCIFMFMGTTCSVTSTDCIFTCQVCDLCFSFSISTQAGVEDKTDCVMSDLSTQAFPLDVNNSTSISSAP